jgi:hypothetical protein
MLWAIFAQRASALGILARLDDPEDHRGEEQERRPRHDRCKGAGNLHLTLHRYTTYLIDLSENGRTVRQSQAINLHEGSEATQPATIVRSSVLLDGTVRRRDPTLACGAWKPRRRSAKF